MWPTSVWNLGVTVTLIYVTLIADLSFTQPATNQLWKFGRVLHLHDGNYKTALMYHMIIN